MLIRVADALYWMSRNIERAEKTAGLLSVQLVQVLETSEDDLLVQQEFDTALNIAASSGEAEKIRKNGNIAMYQVLEYLLFEQDNPNAVLNCVRTARENARSVRDHINHDLWQVINVFYLDVKFAKFEDFTDYQMQNLLRRVKMTSLSVQGVIESTTMRGMPYQMMKVGKWMERAEYTQRTLQAISERLEGDPSSIRYYMRQALQLVNGTEAFMTQKNPTMDPKPILSFIIGHPDFPGSIHYCVRRANEAIEKMQGPQGSNYTQFLFQEINVMIERVEQLAFEDIDLTEEIDQLKAYYTPLQVGEYNR
ncbi:alpha-E domain-containing protein [Geomicrobium sp. JCM 19039]|uniref:alpha-E domain-containing protein n=1 Tax=Geomicrobium sp. JCM 19039 TaxID=1460636 RepID=UPI00045F2A48|nr:alpha-E domain-containing protein [Geomicrobium sp. JCM 19039]GAK14317.1 hypothetical protein JCM19039_4225 [Geomicrobium sp. JCM 19039]